MVISTDAQLENLQGGGRTKPTLLINQYNYKSTRTLAQAGVDGAKIDQAYGGFIIKVADVTEYPTFTAFKASFDGMKLEHRWDAAAKAVKVDCAIGKDTISIGFKPGYQVYPWQAVPTTECFTHRSVNAQWPYLPEGMDRDSSLTQQATNGRLEKNGATLTCTTGRMAYLQTEPTTGTYAGFNPLPDPTLWALDVPGGVRVRADGRVGLLRCIVRPKEGKVWVNYGVKDEQNTSDMATALLVFGLKDAPTVELNGAALNNPAAVTVNGETAYRIPLIAKPASGKALAERVLRAGTTLAALHRPESRPQYVRDWYVAGSFPRRDEPWKNKLTDFGPEKGFDQNATYAGFDRVDGKEVEKPVRWTRILKPGQPALGDGPVLMERLMQPNKGAVAYAYTKITSDRKRAVTLYTGGDQGMVIWLNGEKIFSKYVFRAGAPDQDSVTMTLKKGENTLLLRTQCAWEGWSFYCRVADEYGLPITEGLTFGFGE
ncbi:MAG: hypothetical protein BWY76_00783 [bacterium ADurb.Bin429]|nr:MAG: hypothetical protein BWY76_00783 [bacterium ADurb.Bin429]